MREIEIKKLAELKKFNKEVPTVVVNGEPSGFMIVEQCALVCPNCGKPIRAFQQGIPEAIINKALLEKEAIDALYESNSYCPYCGQKLSYDREVVDIIEN